MSVFNYNKLYNIADFNHSKDEFIQHIQSINPKLSTDFLTKAYNSANNSGDFSLNNGFSVWDKFTPFGENSKQYDLMKQSQQHTDFINSWYATNGIDPTKATQEQIAQANSYAHSMMKNQVTAMDWGNFAFGAATSLYNMYNSNRQYKMAKAQMEDMQRMNHANYQMQAKAYNNNLRNQQSGRSFNGMSGSAKATLGREYNTRKAKDDY